MALKLQHKIAAACFASSFSLGVALHQALDEPDNHVLLHGMITDESAASFIENFNAAAASYNGSDPLVVLINSPGGYMHAGERIIDTIESADIPVVLNCNDLAASMAAEILITTRNVTRNASQDCEIVLHRPRLIETSPTGENITITLEDLYYDQYLLMQIFQDYESDPDSLAAFLYVWDQKQFEIEFLENSSAELAANLADHSHLNAQDFLLFFDYGDTRFNANEAHAFGFIDQIEEKEPDAEASERSLSRSCALWANTLSLCATQSEYPFLFLPEF
ncbi:MAG: ATP-dependent Clp protease proteolytic subunit [Alphaproteobacteria bacterium]